MSEQVRRKLKVAMQENARLKAEVERLKEGNDCLGQMHDKEMERSAYLLEEFNRTTAWGRGLESDLSHARVEISFLKAEVKRLSAADSYLQDANEHAFEKRCDELEAEVERLTKELSNISGWGRGLESDLSHARVEISFLKAEVERLEKDVWRMKVFKGIDEDSIQTLRAAVKTVPEWAKVLEAIENNARLEAENKNLKAEVERLRASSFVTAVPVEQYERVIKAGDALVEALKDMDAITDMDSNHPEVDAWNAAKEGKPSV